LHKYTGVGHKVSNQTVNVKLLKHKKELDRVAEQNKTKQKLLSAVKF